MILLGFSCQSFKKCYFRNKYKLKYLEYDLCSADMGIRANISLCKINNRNTRRRCEICSTSSKMVPEGRCRSDVFIFQLLTYFTLFSRVSIAGYVKVNVCLDSVYLQKYIGMLKPHVFGTILFLAISKIRTVFFVDFRFSNQVSIIQNDPKLDAFQPICSQWTFSLPFLYHPLFPGQRKCALGTKSLSWLNKISQLQVHSELCQTSRMELFAKIVNCF